MSYYDDRARVVQNRASTLLGRVEKDWFLFDFVGDVTEHKTYDKAGRLATEFRSGNAALKSTYAYNIRSWVTGITGTLFTETLTYNTGSYPRWSGDVNKISWKDNRAAQLKTYALSYDTVGRLTTSTFSDAAGSSINFSENVTGYDANGNITGLRRYGRTSASAYGLIDNLAYTYSGNKVTSIKDTGSAAYSSDFRYSNGTNNSYSFSYDAAGRMTADASKGISSITWNVLGLPKTVTFTDGATVSYSYAADGTKLRESRTVSGTTTTTDYTGNLVLENGTRSRLLFDGGYVSVSNSAYHFFITDHLGSVRVVAGTGGTAEQYNHYYTLGGPITQYSTSASLQPLKFQGKEWGSSKGLDLYDFGARRYDPASGRWLSQDPLAEKYYAHSPYLFCAANPVRFVDPEGKEGIKYVDENGVKTVESNIVLLLRAKISYPDNASKKEINRIDRINSRIEQQNENKIREAQVQLNSTYNGETGGSYNSNGELVHFVFNIIGVELDSHPDQSVNIQRLALDNGLSAERFGKPVIAKAPVVYEGPTKGGFGMFSANSITLAPNAPNITLSHEVGHSLGLHDTYPSGGLMNYPPSYGLSSEEVDKIWERAFNRR